MRIFRSYPWLKGFMAGVLFSAVVLPTAVTLAQTYPASFTDLWEVQGDIRGCRMVISGETADVFDNTELYSKPNNRIGRLQEYEYVGLTGVFRKIDGQTAVQIFTYSDSDDEVFSAFGDYLQPVGWVDASKLTQCDWYAD